MNYYDLIVANTLQEYSSLDSVLNTYCPLVHVSQLDEDEYTANFIKAKKTGIAHRWVGQEDVLYETIVATITSLVLNHLQLLDSLAWRDLQKNRLYPPELDWYSDVYPLHDLRDLHKQYEQFLGYPADVIVMSFYMVKSILKILDEEIEDGTDLEIINRLAAAYKLPTIIVVGDCLDKNTIVFLSTRSGFKRVLTSESGTGIDINNYTDTDGVEVTDTISHRSVVFSCPSFAFKVKT